MAVAYNANSLLELPAQIEEAEKAVAAQRNTVSLFTLNSATVEADVMLAAVADGKDAEARKMQREAAAAHNENVVNMRAGLRVAQNDLSDRIAARDRLIREYDALLALFKTH